MPEREQPTGAPSSDYLPWTHLTLDGARRKLAGWHFVKETLTSGEREILYVAEAVLRHLDQMEARE